MKEEKIKLTIDENPKQIGFFDFDDKNISNFIKKINYNRYRNYNLIANIERLNGETITIYVKAEYNGFVFNKKRYIIDTTYKYYNQTFKNYCLDYHEEFTLPINKKVEVDKIREQINAVDKDGVKLIQVSNMVNPYILEQFVNSNLAEGILKGNKINEVLKFLKLWVLVGTIVSCIMLLLFMYDSGMFSGII